MDIEKLLKWGTEYLSDYISVFLFTLRTPATRFAPVTKSHETSDLVLPSVTPSPYVGPNLNPKLFSFMLISVFVGATLNSVVPKRPASPDFATTAIVTVAVWIAYSISVHGACIILGGKGTFLDTMSVSLQLLAVVYTVGARSLDK